MTKDIVSDLEDWISGVSSGVFSYGRRDCCLFAADWVYHRIGIDPAARWRGLYSNRLEALAFVNSFGGISQILETGMLSAGLRSVEVPTIGDVGCLECRGSRVGFVFGGTFFVVGLRRVEALDIANVKILKIWSFQ